MLIYKYFEIDDKILFDMSSPFIRELRIVDARDYDISFSLINLKSSSFNIE